MNTQAGHSILAHSRPDKIGTPRLLPFYIRNILKGISAKKSAQILSPAFLIEFVRGTLRNRKINFFTTSAVLSCIIWVNQCSAQIRTEEMLQKDQMNISQKERLAGTVRDPFSLPLGIHPLSKSENKGETATVTNGEESKVGKVKAILISRHIRLALVDRHIVKIGDSINGEEVVEISPDRVVLGKGGKERTLFLPQSVIPLRVEEN